MKKTIDGKEVFICERCNTNYNGYTKEEDKERAEKCEESCKIIRGEPEIANYSEK